MVAPGRDVRELPGGRQDAWAVLARVETVLADRADDWDDGDHRVVITDELGEHRGEDLERARSGFERRGHGRIQRLVLEARGGAGPPRCRVELGPDRGRVVAEHVDPAVARDLAGTVERILIRHGRSSGSPERGEPGPDSAGREGRGVPGRTVAAVTVVVIAGGAVALVATGTPPASLTRNPWVITVVGGLIASGLTWAVRGLLLPPDGEQRRGRKNRGL